MTKDKILEIATKAFDFGYKIAVLILLTDIIDLIYYALYKAN